MHYRNIFATAIFMQKYTQNALFTIQKQKKTQLIH
jgi:hypothetical protein